MKKILGILAICFVGLFMLASCNDNKTVKPTNTEPPTTEPTTIEPTTVEPETSEPSESTTEPETTTPTEVNSGTILFNIATTEEKDIKTITFNGTDVKYVCQVKLHRELDNKNFIVCATKLVQYDTYFEIECWQAGDWYSLTCNYNEYQYTIMK